MISISAATLALFAVGIGPAVAADPENGERLAAMWCANCHVVTPDQDRASADAPTWPWLAENRTDEQLALFLKDPHAAMPTGAMTRGDVADVIAFIMSFGSSTRLHDREPQSKTATSGHGTSPAMRPPASAGSASSSSSALSISPSADWRDAG
ncbi:MAG: hypothetical protein R3D02_06355 [Hyphomicrobiales bacterium]